MAGEKIEVTQQPASQASIDDFIRGDDNDLAHVPAGRFDTEDRGMGSGVGQPNFALEPPATQSIEEPEIRRTAGEMQAERAQAQQPAQPEQDFQKLYGQSENEKGELRKTVQELLDEVKQNRAEMEAMRQAGWNQPPQVNGYGQYPQPQQPSYSPGQPQQVNWDQVDFIPGKDNDDLLNKQEANDLFRMAARDLQAAQQQIQQLSWQQIQAQKAAVGITPQIEQQLLMTNPWLQQVPPAQQVAAMATLNRQTQEAAPTQSVPTQPAAQPQQMSATEAAQPAARRVTYIETGSGRTSTETEVPLQQRIAAELAEARKQGGAPAMKQVFAKYGMGQVNDFGPGYFTR